MNMSAIFNFVKSIVIEKITQRVDAVPKAAVRWRAEGARKAGGKPLHFRERVSNYRLESWQRN